MEARFDVKDLVEKIVGGFKPQLKLAEGRKVLFFSIFLDIEKEFEEDEKSKFVYFMVFLEPGTENIKTMCFASDKECRYEEISKWEETTDHLPKWSDGIEKFLDKISKSMEKEIGIYNSEKERIRACIEDGPEIIEFEIDRKLFI
ncbi:MAG: hypothetical protein AAB572_01970 [Patescibacteria group bacterium]|mgnify:FL=1